MGLDFSESGGQGTFRVVLGAEPTADVTVTLDNSAPGALSMDITDLVFSAADWNVPRTVTLTAMDNSIADGDKPFVIITTPAVSDDPAYNGMNPPNVEGSVLDDEIASVSVVGGSGLSTSETGTTASFDVVLTCQPTANVTVPVTVSDLTEGAVTVASLYFTTANWNVPQTVVVYGQDDALTDGDVSYDVQLGAATSDDPAYAGFDAADVTLVNVDNDSPGFIVSPQSVATSESGAQATFAVSLTTAPTANVTVSVASSDTTEATVSPASLVFTPADWSTPKQVVVSGVDDPLVDGSINYTVLLGAAVSSDAGYGGLNPPDVAGTNADNDVAGVTVTPTSGLQTTEAGGQATFTLALSAQPSANVTIGLTSSDTTEGTVSPASVVFTSGNWSVPQTVTVTGVDDALSDSSVGYSIVTAAAQSTDSAYSGLSVVDVSVTNLDDEVSSPAVIVTPTTGLVTTEAGGKATFSVVLAAAPTGSVGITLASSDSTEGTLDKTTLIFSTVNWATPQTVTVTGADDAVDDGNVSYSIVTGIVSSDPNYSSLDVPDVSVSNTDNDEAEILVTSSGILQTTEFGGSASFTVVLGCQPSATVSIPVSSSDSTEGTVSPSTLTFTTANWSTPQTVTVSGVNDQVIDGDVAYTVLLGAATSLDPAYSGKNPTDVLVVNADNDPTVSCADPNMIDDMEDGDGNICPNGGRTGGWYKVNDGYGTQALNPAYLIVGGRVDSIVAVQTTGSGFYDWGATLGVNLDGASVATRLPYDVSGHKGITFWARRGSTSYPTSMTVEIVQQNTSKTGEGGTCGTSTSCSDHYAYTVTVGSTWAQYQLPFSSFYQSGWGLVKARDLANVLGFEFLIKYPQSSYSFDLQIDDLAFYD